MLFDSHGMPLSDQVRIPLLCAPPRTRFERSVRPQLISSSLFACGVHPLIRNRCSLLLSAAAMRLGRNLVCRFLMRTRQGLDLHSNPFASLVPQAVMDDHGQKRLTFTRQCRCFLCSVLPLCFGLVVKPATPTHTRVCVLCVFARAFVRVRASACVRARSRVQAPATSTIDI